MKIPTAGPSVDAETLREQIVTARDALTAAVASLDGAVSRGTLVSAIYLDPLTRMVNDLCVSLGLVQVAGHRLTQVVKAWSVSA